MKFLKNKTFEWNIVKLRKFDKFKKVLLICPKGLVENQDDPVVSI